jgi:hypothetical protein
MAVDLITGAAFGVQTVQISIRQVSPSSSHGRPRDRQAGSQPSRPRATVGVNWACSSAGERPLHTREVTGSIPVTPIRLTKPFPPLHAFTFLAGTE